MRIYKKETRTFTELAGIICDICTKQIDTDNGEGSAFIDYLFGYGTKYDSVRKLDIDICEKCLIKLFDKYIKEVPDNGI